MPDSIKVYRNREQILIGEIGVLLHDIGMQVVYNKCCKNRIRSCICIEKQTTKRRDTGPMPYKDIVVQFLEDNKEGMKALLTWFLNRVMEYEVQEQTGAGYYERVKTRRAHRTLNTKLRKRHFGKICFRM